MDWISVEDRLPGNRQSVLVHDERHKHTFGGAIFVRCYFPNATNPWGDHLGITHWMPLPGPPEIGESECERLGRHVCGPPLPTGDPPS